MPDSDTVYGLSEAEIIQRKQWLEFGEADEKVIKETIDPLLTGQIENLIENMYAHFLSFEETRSFFPDEMTLKRAQGAQAKYFTRLTKGNYDSDYVADRLRVGSTHQRIELDPKWYLGAYNRIFNWFLPRLSERFVNSPSEYNFAVSALMKLIFLDMGLAIDCYIHEKEASIRKHRDAIHDLETERKVTQSILGNAPIGIVNVNEELKCVACNGQFVEFVKQNDRSAIIGQSLFDIAPALNRSLFEEVLTTGVACTRSADMLQFDPSTPDENYWDWSTWPVKEKTKITGLIAIFANTTDRVILQQQREDFVATLTHDLKTPVLATNRTIRFLLEGDFGEITESQREILDIMLQSNTSLYSLVQTLLDVYQFDSGVKKLQLHRCNLSSLVAQMVAEIMPLAQSKQIELKCVLPENSSEVRCDDDEIRRVIQNLIDNSLKFTPDGGTITVSMSQDDNRSIVSVTDTGQGILPEHKAKLFQRFWQGESTGRYYASTGLGLYLCRRIIESHSGRIWCESTFGEGSTFFFELPNSI
ncbi:MAG: protoglobin domain-containing protein [Candidatus Obscuribacterales bacterium]|nr:protoglobin domain-containing protein [Candidatus Obscuribacterales bacterium]